MSLSDFFAKLKSYDQHATVIFDRAEPVGQATDLVLPESRWFRRRRQRRAAQRTQSAVIS